jgi:hypothetical protein
MTLKLRYAMFLAYFRTGMSLWNLSSLKSVDINFVAGWNTSALQKYKFNFDWHTGKYIYCVVLCRAQYSFGKRL